jgi:hypothetical protein
VGLAELLEWDAPGVAVEAKFARLRANAHYPDAARAFAAAMLAQAEADRALDGILKDAGRNIAAKCLAYLHVTGGVTLPQLKALCGRIGMFSSGRARALLIYLRYLGYAEPAPERDPGGPRLYVPTERFMQTWRLHMRAMLECAAIVEPEVGRIIEGLDRPEVYDAFVRSISEGYLEALDHVDDKTPYFRSFMHPYAGTQLVHSLVVESPDAFPPRRPIAFSAAVSAQRFGVSRMHVSRMMEAARKRGLVSFPGEGAVLFEPAGREAMDYIYATQLVIFLSAAARTLKACPALAEPSQAA